MAKIQITSKGIVGPNTKLILDGRDVSMFCRGLVLDLSELGGQAILRAEFLCRDLEVEVDDATLELTESKISEKVRHYLAEKAPVATE